jgi:hypothetical protein
MATHYGKCEVCGGQVGLPGRQPMDVDGQPLIELVLCETHEKQVRGKKKLSAHPDGFTTAEKGEVAMARNLGGFHRRIGPNAVEVELSPPPLEPAEGSVTKQTDPISE